MQKGSIESWGTLKCVTFRFIFVFFLLKTEFWAFIPFLGDYLSEYTYYPSFFLQNYLFDFHDTPRWERSPTGSGDTLDDWILNLAYLGIVPLITLIWSLLDRQRQHYTQLNTFLRVWLRYYLAMMMFSYGITKLFVNQMPYPTLSQFYTPLGEFTPMRFAWMHLGYSSPYQFFGGFMETLGGLLLLSRRSTLPGLLLLLGVMGNVFLLNMFYGIPVKLFSFFLVIVILYLLLEYRTMLSNILLNRPSTPISMPPYFDQKWQQYLQMGLKVAFFLYAFVYAFYNDYSYYKERTQLQPLAIEGAFDVDSFKRNGEEQLSPTDTTRWNRIVIDRSYRAGLGYGNITSGTSNFQQSYFFLDSTMAVTVKTRLGTIFKGQIEQQGKDHFLWQGTAGTDSLELVLRRNERDFLLDKRKFMWVMEQKDF